MQKAAKCGDVIVLDALLKAGTLCEGSKILSDASGKARDLIVNCLLQSGVKVDLDAALKKTSLSNQVATVDILIQAGAHTNEHLLERVIGEGLDSMADKLLQAGASIGPEALRSAVQAKLEGIVDKLLLSGTNWNLSTALVHAAGRGYEVMVDKLLPSGINWDLNKPLDYAILDKREVIVDKLVKAGANVDADDVIFAISCQSVPIVRRLLQTGPNLTQRVLSRAAETGQGEIVSLLLHAGANHMIDDALIKAVTEGHENIVEMLLEAGADINASSALGEAVRSGQKAIAQKLIQAGANVTTDDASSAPLVMAMNKGDGAAVTILLKAGASLGPLVNSNSLTNIQSTINEWDPSLVDLVLQEFREGKPRRG